MIRRVAAALLVLAAFGACGGSNDNDAKDATTTSATAPPVTMHVAGVDAIVRGSSIAADGLEVELDDNYFKPNVIIGPPGQQVTLALKNQGKAVHNFTLGDAIAMDVQPGGTANVKVTIPATGETPFFCKFHKDESGMAGVLRVAA